MGPPIGCIYAATGTSDNSPRRLASRYGEHIVAAGTMLAGRIPEIDIGGAGDLATTTRPAYKCVVLPGGIAWPAPLPKKTFCEPVLLLHLNCR